MLPKKNRLPKLLFGLVFKKNKAVFSDHLFLKYFLPTNNKEVRFSVVIPKTIMKKATKRNKTKRQIYSIIQKEIKKIKPPYFGVFLLKKGATTPSFGQIKTEVVTLLRKSQIKVN